MIEKLPANAGSRAGREGSGAIKYCSAGINPLRWVGADILQAQHHIYLFHLDVQFASSQRSQNLTFSYVQTRCADRKFADVLLENRYCAEWIEAEDDQQDRSRRAQPAFLRG